MRRRVLLSWALTLVLAACARPSPSPAPESRAVLMPLPAGRWMRSPDAIWSCLDCPTPRFAVVGARGALSDLAPRSPVGRDGYPMLVLPAELGLPMRDEAVRIDALFEEEADATRWASVRGGEVHAITADAATDRVIVRARRDARGFATADEGAAPICTLAPGAAAIVSPDDVLRLPDAAPWVRLPCSGAHALFRASVTDLDLTTRRLAEGTLEVQAAHGACGATFFEHRVLDESGRIQEVREHATARCFGEPRADDWRVCAQGSLAACVERARSLADTGDDLRRAAGLADYACSRGESRGCALAWRVDLARGVPAPDVLARAAVHCQRDEDELCPEVGELLRAVPAERLRDASDSTRGIVGRVGCLREVPGYCALLESSVLCDPDGCG